MNSLFDIAILSAALGSGLIAGVFYAFSTFVMRALAQLEPSEGIRAMQEINVTVLTPWFIGIFAGLGPLCLLLGGWALLNWSDSHSILVLAGSVLYLVGTLMETVIVHIPMNDAHATVEADDEGSEVHWRRYVSRWTAWNHVRAFTALLAAAAFTLGLCA